MLWWNCYPCIVTDPGRVPPQWVHTNICNGPKQPSLNLSGIVENPVYWTNEALKSDGWGNPDTTGVASGTNHQDHIIVRTARRASLTLIRPIHAPVWSDSNPDAFSGWVNRLHPLLTFKLI